jgi:hypothetical protein
MTPRDHQFQLAVTDAGAYGAAAIDRTTRAITASHAADHLIAPGLLDLLLGPTRPAGPLTQLCGGAPPSTARELYVAGKERALYCLVLDRGEVIVVAAPPTMSVALGWTLARGLAATGPA